MGFVLGSRSKQNLVGVHPDLVRLTELAIQITKQDFTVVQGLRTEQQQASAVKSGNSWTMRSRHLTGHAIDVVPYPVDWNDLNKFKLIRDAFFQASSELEIPIRWGGDWNDNGSYQDEIKRGTYDGGHFELSRKAYP